MATTRTQATLVRGRRHTAPVSHSAYSAVDATSDSSAMAWDGKCPKCRKLMSLCVCFHDCPVSGKKYPLTQTISSDHQEKRYLLEALVEMHHPQQQQPRHVHSARTQRQVYSQSAPSSTKQINQTASKTSASASDRNRAQTVVASSSDKRSMVDRRVRPAVRAEERTENVETSQFANEDHQQQQYKGRSSSVPTGAHDIPVQAAARRAAASKQAQRTRELPAFDAKKFVTRYYQSQKMTYDWEPTAPSTKKSIYYATSPTSDRRREPERDYPVVVEL